MPFFGTAPLTADEGLRVSYQLQNDRSTGVDIVVLGSCIKNVLGCIRIGENWQKSGKNMGEHYRILTPTNSILLFRLQTTVAKFLQIRSKISTAVAMTNRHTHTERQTPAIL